MITNDEELNQALEALGLMYRAMASLRKDMLARNRKWFNLMAEGPVDEIRKIQAEIDAYTGMDQVVIDDEDARESAEAKTRAEVGSIGS
ncbi:MAG: hypothetical protein ABSH35_24840 [Isosphaeraceae bacterium]|jgi:hypothetical protein